MATSRPGSPPPRAASRRVYETPAQYHNAMEPHAIVARWDGDRLSIDTPSQGLAMAQAAHRRPVRHPAGEHPYPQPVPGRRVRLEGADVGAAGARHHGGAPGRPAGEAGAAARADVRPGRPSRADAADDAASATDDEGALTAISHHTQDDVEHASTISSSRPRMSRTRCTRARRSPPPHEAVRLDTGTPLFMRAPGEATGSIALESAIDEMAQACGMDPLAFRLKNYAEVEPISGKPFSSKALRECYAQGAERFGWSHAAAGAAADARRGGAAGRLGHGHRDLPGADVPGAGAGGDPARRQRRDGDRRARHGAGRLDRARADRRRQPRARPRRGRVPLRHVRPAGCGHRRRVRAYRDGGHGDPRRRRGCDRQARRRSPPATSARRCSARAMPA